MRLRPLSLALLLLAIPAAPVAKGDVFALIEPDGENDRYTIRFSAPPETRTLKICEPNVRWGCRGSQARFRNVPAENGPAGRSWFRTTETSLLWDKKRVHVRTQGGGGNAELVLRLVQEKAAANGDLTSPEVGDAKPVAALVGKPCVFAYSPVPRPNGNGERGTTYPSHRTSRDYSTRDDTKLYAMGTCETVKRIDTGTEHPCGYGIALRCLLNDQVMGLLYCHLSRPAERKRFFGIGELVGYSGHSGTDNPHLHLGLTFENHEVAQPHPAPLEDEELLMPGLPVPGNDPDRWFRENGCYADPRSAERGEGPRPILPAPSASVPAWDGLSFVGTDIWSLEVMP